MGTLEEKRAKQAARMQAWRKAHRAAYLARRRARYAANPEKFRAQRRADYAANPKKDNAYSRAWHKANPERCSAAVCAWQRLNPEKANAKNRVCRAVKKGLLVRRPICDRCGKKRKTEFHHEDYSKPLEVVQVCKSCHSILNRERCANQESHAIRI